MHRALAFAFNCWAQQAAVLQAQKAIVRTNLLRTSQRLVQSDLVTSTPIVPSRSVVVTWMSLYRCTAMYRQDRACPLETCHIGFDVTVTKVTITKVRLYPH